MKITAQDGLLPQHKRFTIDSTFFSLVKIFNTMYEQYTYPCSRIDHSAQDVSLAAMFVSAKMHDTLKKPRELLAVAYAIRFPDLAAKSKHLGGDVDLDTMDPSVRLFFRHDVSFQVRFFNFFS